MSKRASKNPAMKTLVDGYFNDLYVTENYSDFIYESKLSISPNTKVKALRARLGLLIRESGCLNFTSIVTCFGRAACAATCYAYLQNSRHKTSKQTNKNTAIMLSSDDRVKVLEDNFKGKKLIRLNADGDFPSQAVFDSIVEFAIKHSEIVLYGYTKNFAYVLNAYNKYGRFPSNLRIALSVGYNVPSNVSTESTTWHNSTAVTELQISKLVSYGFKRAFVVFDKDEMTHLPWNDGDMEAYKGESDFRILYHYQSNKTGKKCKAQYNEILAATGIEAC